MQPNPLINPYNQTTAALMQGLLAETKFRFAIDPTRLTYVRSEVPAPETEPGTAYGYYRDTRRGPDSTLIPLRYDRLDIDVYANLYPYHLRHVPWVDREFTDDELLIYVSQNLGMLLLEDEVVIVREAVTQAPRSQAINISPKPQHAIWYGTLHLWAVEETDLRSVITHHHYPQFDPTALS